MRIIHIILAALAALVTGGMLAAAVYLAFVYPKTIAVWLDQGRALSEHQLRLADVGSYCSSHGLLIMPALFVGFVGSLVWLALVVTRK